MSNFHYNLSVATMAADMRKACMNEARATKMKGQRYTRSVDQARHWHKRLITAMKELRRCQQTIDL